MVNWHLLPGEKKIYNIKTSWKVFLKFYLLAFLFLGLSVYSLMFDFLPASVPTSYASTSFAGLFLVFFAIPTSKRNRERVLITTERVLIRKTAGIGKQTNFETVTFNNLINVRVLQSRSQKMLGIGDVVFKLSGDEHTATDVGNPYAIEKAVYKIIEKEKQVGKSSGIATATSR